MAKRKESRTGRIAGRTFEQLVTFGAFFMLVPYIQAKLTPIRAKVYGGDPNIPNGTAPIAAIANPESAAVGETGPVSVAGPGAGTAFNLQTNPPKAPTGDTPAPAGGPDWGAVAGPLGGIFLGS